MAKLLVKRKAPADHKAVAKLKALLAENRTDLPQHHKIGRLVATFVPAESAYKKKQMPELLDQLGFDRKDKQRKNTELRLYAARNFYLKYKKGLTSLKGLEYGHVSILVGIKDDTIRETFQQKCKTQKWSMRELRARIQEKIGKRSPGGRKFAGLKKVGPRESLLRILWLRKTALTKCVPALEQNIAQLTKRMRQRPDDEFIALVDDACAALEDLREAVQKAQAKLRKFKPASKAATKKDNS